MNASLEAPRIPPLETAFGLEGLTIDPRAGDVSGPGGRETLDPKVMGVLLLLAQRAGQVVSRDDLLARVWPGVVVSDDALSRQQEMAISPFLVPLQDDPRWTALMAKPASPPRTVADQSGPGSLAAGVR